MVAHRFRLFQAALLIAACAVAAQTDEYERARLLLGSGRAEEAAKIFRELSRADPHNAGLLLNLSIAEYKAAHFDRAAESAEAALKIDPDLLPASLFLGASRLELGDFAGACAPLERFADRNPDDRNGRLMLGEALLGAGKPASALVHLEAASRMLPDNPKVWYNLWKMYDALGRKSDSEAAARTLQRLPPSLELHLYNGELNNAEHRWREAAAEFEQALNLSPRNRSALLDYVWALFRSRDYDAAVAAIKSAGAALDSAQMDFLYGASLVNLQEPAQAIAHLEAALARDPTLLAASAALGQALLQTGKPAAAIPLLERALPTDPDGTVHFQLFRAYQLMNRTSDAERARAAYQRFRDSTSAAH